MEVTTLCAVVVCLRVSPNRSQFFIYETITVSCEGQEDSSKWTVRRSTMKTNTQFKPWNPKNQSHVSISDSYFHDSGVYWCESETGERSDTVNITVTGSSVILDSPVLPVMEGEDVTLHCRTQTSSSSSSSSSSSLYHFFKDELLIGSSSTGNWTIHRVSRSDEGLYRCNSSEGGDSPDSRLTVRVFSEPPSTPLTHILLPVLAVCLMIVLMLLCLWRSHKGKVDPAVSYTDVTIAQDVIPHRIRELGDVPTFYSTLNLDAT